MQSGTYKRLLRYLPPGVTSSSREPGVIHRARITLIASLSLFRVFENGNSSASHFLYAPFTERFCTSHRGKKKKKTRYFRYRAVRGTPPAK